MSLSGALTYQGDVLRLNGLDLKVDTTAITGGLAYSLATERPSLGANLTIDRLNLDLYQTPAGPEDPPMDINGLVAQLGRADLNAQLQIGRLVLDGETISSLEAAFTTTEGQVSVQQLQIADLAGARIAASDVVLKSGDSLAATGKAQIATTDFKRLLRFAGQDDLPLDLKASSFQTATSFELRDGALGLNGNATLDGTTIVMRAQSGGTGSMPKVSIAAPRRWRLFKASVRAS